MTEIEKKLAALLFKSERSWHTVSGHNYPTRGEAEERMDKIKSARGKELVEWRVHDTGSGWVIQWQ